MRLGMFNITVSVAMQQKTLFFHYVAERPTCSWASDTGLEQNGELEKETFYINSQSEPFWLPLITQKIPDTNRRSTRPAMLRVFRHSLHVVWPCGRESDTGAADLLQHSFNTLLRRLLPGRPGRIEERQHLS